ncbi:Bardet-Biedl syndrome 7 protein homolog isoform X2 [Spodoptera frugiperda]|uniref:Bardet-Biedl syndrome 7 protein homolog isoform X2 n=1 Tax=Spodoptera frugiperda TaxID=7108 RepID=A0A9R0EFW3_SPOFR|nr:Bardet-Biedl syndrome 7 protein homolog isoform X2 [Spodoptera frugiperda]
MDYDLSRIDYGICGITYPDTLKILPPSGQKMEQKFAIGDKNGVLQCLSIKDEEPVVQFKTLPGKPITSVQLASSVGTQADKIFTASGNEVKGYTRKGKVFLSIETSLTETITSMYLHFRCIIGSDLILCSGRIVTYYRDLREYNSYICDDRVLDIAAFASTRVRLLVLIANKGAILLENGKLISRTTIPSGPSRLAVPPSTHVTDIIAFYGAGDGSIGIITYEELTLSSKCLVDGRGLGSVVCLGWYFNNGNYHLSVGRHDGSIQLYLVDMENFGEKPRLKYTYFCGEPVTSVVGGCVGTEESELLVATFSGRIFGLRSSHLVTGAKVPQDILATRRGKLEVEVARLEKQTANEREKYQRNTRSLHAGLSTPPLLDIQYELLGATNDGWQEVRITSAVPLDMLFINSNKKLAMQTDTAAVLSICSSKEAGPDLLASVRCQAGTRRVWVKMREISNSSTESKFEGSRVLIYALPAGAPRVARLVTLKLPALPYYSSHEALEKDFEKRERVWCQLEISGNFSVAEITSWLTEALPGELPRPASNVSFTRSHTLLDTILVCQYERGHATFKSDNVSTIATIRNIVSNCSVEKSIRVEMSCDIPDNCCLASFKQLEDKFKREYKKNKDIILKNAISMLDLDSSMNEEGPILCQDYATVWDSRDSINETQFEELVDIILQWYLDWRTLSLLENFNNESTKLKVALKECKVDDIIKILSKNVP